MINRIKSLIIKELLILWRDPHTRIILLVPPLIQLLIFSFASTHDVKNVSLGIFCEDSGEQSRELLSKLYSIPATFSNIERFFNMEELKKSMDKQKILVGLRIEKNFSKNLDANKRADIQIILDGRKINSSVIVFGYLNSIIQSFFNEKNGKNTEIFTYRVWYNPELLSMWSTVPALIGILTNLIALLVTALSIARERELGTFDQLLVSPLRPFEILIGKTVPAMLLGLFEVSLMMSIFVFVFGIPFTGSIILMYMVLFLFILSIVGIGLFISSISKTQQQGFLGAFSYMMPAVLLSGYATPISNIPAYLRWICYINPLQYMVSASRTIFLENPKPIIIFSMVWPLIPIALITLFLASWMFGKRLE
jgi:ABC-2 type transport system permease protein